MLGLRVILSSAPGRDVPAATKEAACRHVASVVHGLWASVHSRHKDYIAAPKANGYQSLHLAVCVPAHILAATPSSSAGGAAHSEPPKGTTMERPRWPPGTLAELQIRTDDMHRAAETGASAHFAYKGGLDEAQTQRLQEFTGRLMQVRATQLALRHAVLDQRVRIARVQRNAAVSLARDVTLCCCNACQV